MDKICRQAYLNLINQLLNCPSGEREVILNANSELIDAELVQMMEQVADDLGQQGDENNATWLRDLASQLGKMIANRETSATSEAYVDFLKKVLQVTIESSGNPQMVYPLLEAKLNLLDDRFAQLLRRTMATLPQQETEPAQDIAIAISNFSTLIAQLPLGNRASNLEIAITGYELVGTVITRQVLPKKWAAIQNNLGSTYLERLRGNKGENLEAAIGYFSSALEVYNRENFPQQSGMSQQNLGIAYGKRLWGDRGENLEAGIHYYSLALKFYTREDFPEKWAAIQNNLGSDYLERLKGNKGENLEAAIRYFSLALEVYNRTYFPERWATTQLNLGIAYRERIRGEKAENLEAAIRYFSLALEILTPEGSSEEWAITQNNLGIAYRQRLRGKWRENLEVAINCFSSTLEIFTLEAFPEDWAATQTNIGSTYRDRIEGEKVDNLEKVIQCYLAALEVLTSQTFPEKWATLQNNLGVAYLERLMGERAENLEAAIHYFSSALEVRTRQAFPYDWAITQNNLGITYRERLTGERIENLETAIHYFSSALEVRTRQVFPEKYAATQSNLGFAYQDTQQFQSAYIAFADAIDTIESLRSEIISGSGTEQDKQTLAQQWNNLYRRMVEVCLQLNKPTEAIEYAEHSKTRNLVEQIFTRDLKSIVTQEEDLKKLEQLRDAIASGQYEIQNAKAENSTTLAQHLQQLRHQRNELQDKYLPVGSGFQFEQFQQTLNDKIAIVYLYITNTGLEIFIITCESLKHLNVSNLLEKQALVNWANEYLETYNQNKTEWLNSLASRLSHLSKILNIDEIINCEEIKKCSSLILIPHRFLHLFPLHALPLANGDFLCDRFPEGVGYAPSCQLLLQAQKRKRPDFTNLFAIQNPTKDRPYVDFGVEAIRPYFQPNDYVLPGDKAIKANLIQSEQLRSAHCFHFFGHATFNFEKSALILADGHLTLGEIFALDLNQCRLVILSACETGMTDFNSISDEYIGLPSGFLFAGSPSVVSTLWEVDQLSAAFLMIEFYENLRKYKQLKEGDIAIALNLSQKRLRDLTVDEFKKHLVQYKPLIDEILSKLPKVERRKAEASIIYRLSQAYPFAHPSDWAAFTATGI